MDFATLALISLVGVLGPLLALPRRWNLPVVLGELVAGIVLGHTGFDVLHAGNSTFTFLADIGFALIMFVAGSCRCATRICGPGYGSACCER